MITAAIKVFARKNAFDQSYPTSKIINHLVREFAFFQPIAFVHHLIMGMQLDNEIKPSNLHYNQIVIPF